MSKYIGTPVVSLVTDTVDVTGDITTTDATPEIIIVNNTSEDTDGGREGKVTFKGQQSGGEETTLAQIQASHDGTSDDEKGDLIFKTNDGSDGSSPTERLRIDSTGKSTFKDDVGIEGATPTLQMYDTSVTNNVTDISYDEQYTIDIDPNNARGNSGLAIKLDGTEKYRFIDTAAHGSGLGIGIAAPLRQLHISNTSANSEIAFTAATNGVSSILFGDGQTGTDIYRGYLQYNHSDDAMLFASSSAERMRLDSSGNLLHDKTASDGGVAGHELRKTDFAVHTVASTVALIARRLTDDGDVITIQGNSGSVGHIGCVGADMYIGDGDCNMFFADSPNVIGPCGTAGSTRDNAISFGNSSNRWSQLFAGTGSINTSDENEKQQIASLTDEEIAAAKAISKLFKTFKWNDAVTEKGDNARIHTGVIAQQVATALTDNGLDPNKYAFYCSDTWWEVEYEFPEVVEKRDPSGNINVKAKSAFTDKKIYYSEEEAPEGATKVTRLGVRYEQLLAFIAAATEQRLTSLETQNTTQATQIADLITRVETLEGE